jgi:cytochrome c5
MAKLLATALGCASILALASCQTQDTTTAATATPATPAVAAAPAPAPQAPQPVAAVAGAHPGEGVYKASCAACHDNTETTRAPSRDNLKAMSFQLVNYSLTQGKRRFQPSSARRS